jgi:hypothetical protein
MNLLRFVVYLLLASCVGFGLMAIGWVDKPSKDREGGPWWGDSL